MKNLILYPLLFIMVVNGAACVWAEQETLWITE
jgi:hypothetical protein